MIGLLVVGAIGLGYWGYQEHQEKNAVLIHAENNYQRAFHDLTYQMDLLHEKIGTTLAMNSKKSLSPALADVWRITSEARGQVGQLPLTLLPFNKTEEFLSNIGKFSYQTAVRDLGNDPLTEEEFSTLEKLYNQSNDIRTELRRVQHLVLKNNLRWMDVELAIASGKENADNTIIDGFKTVEKHATGFDEENLEDPALVSFQEKDENYEHLEGKQISKEEAISLAKTYSGIDEPTNVSVTKNGEGASYGFYNVTLKNGKDSEATLDITKKGGYPIWFIHHRPIKSEQLSLNEAMMKAEQFLKKHQYKNLEMTDSVQYDSVGLFTFVTLKDGVRVYPDSIKVKVALDDGNIVGFAANDYLKNNRDDEIETPHLSLEDAKQYLNPNVTIMEDRLAIIENELGEKVLCYEFIGTMKHDDTYRIYINAENGIEEKVEKLQKAEPIYENII